MNIATLTMNPALDRTILFNTSFIPGKMYRIGAAHENASGKGINVSKVLKNLGIDVRTFCFTGGTNGIKLKNMLDREGIDGIYVETGASTRMNIKIIDKDSVCTEINESGGPVTLPEVDELLRIIDKTTDNTQYFVISGSIPQGVDKAVYNFLIKKLKERGITAILDCDGEALRMGVESKPDIIKPNIEELSQLLGTKISTAEQAVEKSEELHMCKSIDVLCTMGGNGAVYAGKEGLFTVDSPQIEIRGFSGAGDTFLAAFLYEKHQSGDMERALTFASSAAAAKVEMVGTDIPNGDEMRKYTDEIKVIRLR